jgi:nucleoside-diphosphate kinase
MTSETTTQRTFSIVKPDAMAKKVLGQILATFEEAGLSIIAGRIHTLKKEEAEQFYAEHKERSFFGELVDYMCSGPVFISVLEGEDAVAKNRTLMGATDPAKADAGTIRARFGDSIGANAVHGSDSPTSAAREIALFFPGLA